MPRRSISVRQLVPGDQIPVSTPKRYLRQHGYVVLRWHVGKNQYVEAYEHRILMGLPAAHVHHRNGVRHDNRLENLEVLEASLHYGRHGLERRKFDRAEAAMLYRSGWNTLDLAELYDVNCATLSRALRATGVEMRSSIECKTVPVDALHVAQLFHQGFGIERIAAVIGVGTTPIYRMLKALNLRRKPGRPFKKARRQ